MPRKAKANSLAVEDNVLKALVEASRHYEEYLRINSSLRELAERESHKTRAWNHPMGLVMNGG